MSLSLPVPIRKRTGLNELEAFIDLSVSVGLGPEGTDSGAHVVCSVVAQ